MALQAHCTTPHIGHTRVVVDDDLGDTGQRDSIGPPRGQDRGISLTELRDRVAPELRDVSFPAAVRGYDRHAVDAYVERVNRIIAELEVGGSPQAAVRHALDRVGEQTSGILQRARETAEEVISSAREEAEETTTRSKSWSNEIVANAKKQADDILNGSRAEAQKIVANARAEAEEHQRRSEEEGHRAREEADARVRELRADADSLVTERRRLIDEVRHLAAQLEELAAGAAGRFEPAEEPEAPRQPEAPEAPAELPQPAASVPDEP